MLLNWLRISFLWILLCLKSGIAFSNSDAVNYLVPGLPPPVLSNPSACNLNLTIPDFNCDENNHFKINVSSAPGNALGTNVFLREVRLIIMHAWAADLDIYLVSPSGVRVELATDNGSGDDNYGQLTGLCNQYTSFLSASLPSSCNSLSITQGHAPFIGNFLPEGNLNDFNNGSSPLGMWTLEVCDDGREHIGKLEFVELIFEGVSCLSPSSPIALTVDSTSVLLNWKPGSSCNATIIEYGLPGFIPGTGATGNGIIKLSGCPPFTLTGLNPSTPYELYIREQCGPSSFSANSCKIAFVTKCSPPPATIKETFNGQTLCAPFCGVSCDLTGSWRNARNDHFDWTVYSGVSPTSQTGAQDDVPGGGKYLYIETTGGQCQQGNEAVLLSNCIEVRANADSCDLSFNYIMNGAHINALILQASIDGGLTWQMIWQASGNLGPNWLVKNIDLDPFHGKVTQFRFIGKGGSGPRGDIAIDNIAFYGSIDLGPPTHTYYFDQDGDGYGRSEIYFSTCGNITIPGFVALGGDCDDQDPFFNPGVPESPCDGVDLNCNGFADEGFLPPPAVKDIAVCSGGLATLVAIPAYGGTIYWYSAATFGSPIHLGTNFSPSLPLNLTPNSVNHVFYAEEVAPGGCVSTSRKAATITVLPQPKISTKALLEGCKGEALDLSAINIIDANGANGTLTYFSKTPLVAANKIGHIVHPARDTSFYILSVAQGGCKDSILIPVKIAPSPLAKISGMASVCRGSSTTLSASDQGSGLAPLNYIWNNGMAGPSISVFGSTTLGESRLFSVTISGANGCTSNDSILVTSITNISSVQTSVSPVTTCNGSNGSITVAPLNGMAPFTYQWNGGSTIIQAGGLTVSNLSQGTYSFTISDSSPQACPFTVPFVLVNGPSAVVTIREVKNVSCPGGNDGCITISVEGNNPTIKWSNGEITPTVCGLSAGIHHVTVTDGSCVNTLKIPVGQPEPITASVSIKDASCFNSENGAIAVTVFGGSLPYKFLWNNGMASQNLNNLKAATYRGTITDANGCQHLINDAIVKEPQSLNAAQLAWQPVSCAGKSDGKIDISVSGGALPYTYAWSNGAAGSAVSNIKAGTYRLSVTDANKCQLIKEYLLPEPLPVTAQFDKIQNPVCRGIHNGEILITPKGGNGNYTYLWNNGRTTEDLTSLPPGKYSVQIKDNLGCIGNSDTITLAGPENMLIEVDKKNPSCVGIDNGHLKVVVKSGGEAPFKFAWSTDFSGPELINMPAANYGLTITDNKGCRLDTTLTLVASQPIAIQPKAFSPPCFGTATGQLSLLITGGVQPYAVKWSTGQHGTTIAGLPAANYSATATDATGCIQQTGLIPLTQPPQFTVKTESVEGIVCHGDSEGRIDVSVSGGTPPYKYFWSNNKTTEDIIGLKEGFYRLTVTDAANCVITAGPFNIVSPGPVIAVADVQQSKPCEAVSFDNVCVDVSGGLSPYQFRWSNNLSSACLNLAPVGDYSLTITDAAGCTKTIMSVKVPEATFPVSVKITPGSIQNICSNTSNGVLEVAIRGGVKPFQFIWNNGTKGITSNDTLRLINLPAGSYRVTITDNTGCVAISESLQVASIGPLQLTAPGNQIQHVKCKSGQDGSINVNVIGGLKPYNFTWTNSLKQVISNQEDLFNLGTGIYTLILKDSIGCVASLNVEIKEPLNSLSFSIFPPIITPVTCYENPSGSINIHPAGGVPPYSFAWSNGRSSEDISGLFAGAYFVTLTDSSLCTVVSPVLKVDGPTVPLALANVVVGNISCFGKSDGFLSPTLKGGTTPYTFEWSNFSTSKDLFNLSSGTYKVIVRDKNSCQFDTAFQVKEPAALKLMTGSIPSINGNLNGKAFASAAGGNPPYNFIWGNGTKGDTLQNLVPGNYKVTVNDTKLCEASSSVDVELLVASTEKQNVPKILMFPNPGSGFVTLKLDGFTYEKADISVLNQLGQQVPVSKQTNSTNNSVKLDFLQQTQGIYFVVIQVNGKLVFSERLLILR